MLLLPSCEVAHCNYSFTCRQEAKIDQINYYYYRSIIKGKCFKHRVQKNLVFHYLVLNKRVSRARFFIYVIFLNSTFNLRTFSTSFFDFLAFQNRFFLVNSFPGQHLKLLVFRFSRAARNASIFVVLVILCHQ